MNRTILHCDLNCFFASVEMLYYPGLRNKPMAIAGDPDHRHGIILAKNVLAKKAGVKTAQTINEALQKCPNLIIRKPNYELYDYYSDKVRKLYYEYTDRIEPFGVDECWLDISESIPYFKSKEKIVNDLLFRVKDEIGLTLSIGISNNKIYAKLGSDLALEDSYKIIDGLEDVKDIPASNLLFVGKRVNETLKTYGIYTINDLANKPIGFLEKILGKHGTTLYKFANGLDDSEVSRYDELSDELKSISHNMTTIRDIENMDDFKIALTSICDHIATRLKDKGLYYRTIHLMTRNNKLQVKTMQISLKENSNLRKDIYDYALKLFKDNNCNFKIPYRSIGISLSNLSDTKDLCQLNLFEKSNYSYKDLNSENAIETIRKRFGYDSISSLRLLEDNNLISINKEYDG